MTMVCMKLNALPFLFLPGFVLAGYLAGRWSGVAWALAVWGTAVAIGTVAHLMRHMSDASRDTEAQDGDVTSSKLVRRKG